MPAAVRADDHGRAFHVLPGGTAGVGHVEDPAVNMPSHIQIGDQRGGMDLGDLPQAGWGTKWKGEGVWGQSVRDADILIL